MDKDPKNNTFEAELEEYRQLREEIRHHLGRRYQSIYLAILISLGVIGVGLTLKNYMLFLSSTLLISILWFDEIRRLQGIFRIASYIEVFIETEIAGLKWETLVGKHKIQTSFIRRLIANAEFPFLFLLHSSLGLFLIISVSMIATIVIAIVLMIIFFSLLIRSHNVSTKGRKKEIEFWENIREERQMVNKHFTSPNTV